jgi:hypothetical protein
MDRFGDIWHYIVSDIALFTYFGCHVTQGGQDKYNTCRCRQRYRGRYGAYFCQWKYGLTNVANVNHPLNYPRN